MFVCHDVVNLFTWMNNTRNHLVIRMMHLKSKLKITDKHTHIHTLTRARGNLKLVPLYVVLMSVSSLVVVVVYKFEKPTMIKLTTFEA